MAWLPSPRLFPQIRFPQIRDEHQKRSRTERRSDGSRSSFCGIDRALFVGAMLWQQLVHFPREWLVQKPGHGLGAFGDLGLVDSRFDSQGFHEVCRVPRLRCFPKPPARKDIPPFRQMPCRISKCRGPKRSARSPDPVPGCRADEASPGCPWPNRAPWEESRPASSVSPCPWCPKGIPRPPLARDSLPRFPTHARGPISPSYMQPKEHWTPARICMPWPFGQANHFPRLGNRLGQWASPAFFRLCASLEDMETSTCFKPAAAALSTPFEFKTSPLKITPSLSGRAASSSSASAICGTLPGMHERGRLDVFYAGVHESVYDLKLQFGGDEPGFELKPVARPPPLSVPPFSAILNSSLLCNLPVGHEYN